MVPRYFTCHQLLLYRPSAGCGSPPNHPYTVLQLSDVLVPDRPCNVIDALQERVQNLPMSSSYCMVPVAWSRTLLLLHYDAGAQSIFHHIFAMWRNRLEHQDTGAIHCNCM